MKSRKTNIENADTPAKVKPGERGLLSTAPYDAKKKTDGRQDWDSVEMGSSLDH